LDGVLDAILRVIARRQSATKASLSNSCGDAVTEIVDDLEFGEVLPEKPGWMQQQEYEERTGVAFHLERIAKKL
jgi:hypothetical protein